MSSPELRVQSHDMRSRGLIAAGVTVLLTSFACGWLPHGEPVDIVFVTWDSTRADHLSAYGYPRPTTPALEALAGDAVRFETAIAQHNWTKPSYASIFTSLHNWEFPGLAMGPAQLTLPEILRTNARAGRDSSPGFCTRADVGAAAAVPSSGSGHQAR